MTSRDGRFIAYVARRRFGNDIRECIILGDRIGPYFNWVQRPALSPDGTKLAYLAAKNRGKDDFPLFIVIGDKIRQVQFKDRRTDSNWNPVFSPDGTKLVFQTEQNGEHANVVADIDDHPPLVEDGHADEFTELSRSIGPEFDVVDRPTTAVALQWPPIPHNVCGMYLLRRRSDPYSIAITCLPILLLPVFFTSLWGARTVVHGFQAMAQTGSGMEEAVSGLELGSRVYFLGHVASSVTLIMVLVVGGASLFLSEAKRDRSNLRTGIVVVVAAVSTAGVLAVSPLQTRNILHPLVGLTEIAQYDVSDMPLTLEAGRALGEEITDANALSARISKTLLHLSVSAFVLFFLSLPGFVAGIVLGRGTGMARPVAVLGLVLTAVAIMAVCLQAYRHRAIGDEIGRLADAQGISLQQD